MLLLFPWLMEIRILNKLSRANREAFVTSVTFDLTAPIVDNEETEQPDFQSLNASIGSSNPFTESMIVGLNAQESQTQLLYGESNPEEYEEILISEESQVNQELSHEDSDESILNPEAELTEI